MPESSEHLSPAAPTLVPAAPESPHLKEYYRVLQPTPEGGPGCTVHEVSPVLVGAGNETMTMAAKGVKFCDELEMALAAVDNLIGRTKSLAELRAKEGRGLPAANVERLGTLRERLKAAVDTLAGIPTHDEAALQARVELRRYLRTQAGLPQ